ncbi:MAG: hypothetical protein Q9195_007302 [Heterodermia aff. obscurata]
MKGGRRPTANTGPTTTTSSPSVNHSSSDSRLSQPPTPDSELPNDHVDWNFTLSAKDFDHHPQPIGLLELHRSLSNPPTTNSFPLDSPITNRDFSDPFKFDHQNVHLADTPALVATNVPTLTQPTALYSSLERENKTRIKLGEKKFSTFLQLCIQLQKHVENLAGMASEGATYEVSTTSLDLQEMLGDVDRSCNAIFDVYGLGTISKPAATSMEEIDHASISLVTALVFKVFQVCETVLSCKELRNQGLIDLFLQKRLDFNLMQARIVMSKIDEQTQGGSVVPRAVALAASHIENKIKVVN